MILFSVWKEGLACVPDQMVWNTGYLEGFDSAPFRPRGESLAEKMLSFVPPGIYKSQY